MEMRFGDSGRAVREIQALLMAAGKDLGRAGVDGQFGRYTESAVRAFQAERHLPVTGIVDSTTLVALGMALNVPVQAHGFDNCGLVWPPLEFRNYLRVIPVPSWCKGITMHHTASPSLDMRPDGLTFIHMENIRDYYRKDREWTTGPHLFVDDRHVLGLTPLTVQGTHAQSFNRTHLGIEVLGDYDTEDPQDGRGYSCWLNAALIVSDLLGWLGLETNAINFHRDDERTSKSCPGHRVTLEWFAGLVRHANE